MGATLYGGRDGLILKMDLNGSLLSAQTVGGNKNDRINSVFPSSDGGIFFAGESYSTNMGWENQGCADAFVGKYDSKGQQEWVRALVNSSCGRFHSVVEMSDGGVVAVGSNEGATAVKYNSAGEQEWVQDFGQRFAEFRDVIEGENGEIVIVGNRLLGVYTRDAIIVKCDALGNLQWEQVLGDESSWSTFFDVSISNDGNFIAAGQMGNDGVVVKFNHDGEYELLIQQVQNDEVEFNSVLMLPSGEIVVVGDSWATDFEFENKGDNDIILIKYSPKTDADIQINGTIETLIADVTIPSVSPDLVIDPNSPDGVMSPEFSIVNQSNSPIKLDLKTFEQTTNTFNDVLPDKYDSWEGLNKTQSQDLALGLIAKDGDGWQRLTTPMSYVAGHSEHEIGVIKPTSQVNFEFEVHHGRAFSESKTVQYKMVFVFDLLN